MRRALAQPSARFHSSCRSLLLNLRKLLAAAALVFTGHGPSLASDAPPLPLQPYVRMQGDYPRTYVFDASRSFVNNAGVNDLATIHYNGTVYTSFGDYNGRHIVRQLDVDGAAAIKVLLGRDDLKSNPLDASSTAYRTQLNSFPLQLKRTYVVDIEFRIGDKFMNSDPSQDGLLWQLKTDSQPGQHSNPSIALVLKGDSLTVDINYPRLTSDGSVPKEWTASQVERMHFPVRKLVEGVPYWVRLAFAADDRPQSLGGQGLLVAWFQGEQWDSYFGPTVLPFQKSEPRVSFGWYQWNAPAFADRHVFWRRNSIYTVQSE